MYPRYSFAFLAALVALVTACSESPRSGTDGPSDATTTDRATETGAEDSADATTPADLPSPETTTPDGTDFDVAPDSEPLDVAPSDTPPSDTALDAPPRMDAEPAPRALADVSPATFRRNARTTVVLDGRRSMGGALRYAWVLGSGTVTAGALDAPMVSVAIDGASDLEAALRVSNAAGSDVARFVARANDPPAPAVASVPVGTVGSALRLDATATRDPEGDPLAFAWRLVASPAGASPGFTGASMPIATLTPDRTGTYRVELVVSDPLGPGAAAHIEVNVVGRSRNPPVVTVTAMPGSVAVGAPVTLQVNATGDAPIARRTLAVNGSAVPLDAAGSARFTPARAGAYDAVAEATDADGNVASATATFTAHATADNGPPTVALTAPADGAALTAPTDVVGTASDGDLARYVLEVALANTTRWTRIAEGTSSVTAARLGTLDPTLFDEGSYTLRLRAIDAWGREARTTRSFRLEGVAAVGAFRVTFRDLAMTVLGVPLRIERTYDSFDRRDGPFGQNWSLQAFGGRMELPQVTGEGWRAVRRCNPFDGAIPIAPTQPHEVVLRLGGRSYRAVFEPRTEACWFFRYPMVTARWTLAAPTFGATVQIDGEGELLTLDDDARLYRRDGPNPASAPVYAPRSARLNTPDGRSYTFDLAQGVTGVRDAYGNSLAITPTGITATGGMSLAITRDPAGHITALARPDGTRRTYEYNRDGDLVSTTDFAGARLTYLYGPDHLLLRVVDAVGNDVLRNEYDPAGRLVARNTPEEGRVAIVRDVATRTETATDGTGAVRRTTYTPRGQIASFVDPVGNTVRYEYDPRGNRTAWTDPLGNRTSFVYDTRDRVVEVRHPTGRVERYTWDDTTGSLLAWDDGLGHVSRRTYSPRGELTSYTSPGGAALAYGYDARGFLTSVTLPDRSRALFSRDMAGNLTGMTDARGFVHAFTLDASLQLLRDRVTAGTENLDTDFTYDPEGNVTSVRAPDGTLARRAYDLDGRPTQVTDPLGRTYALLYGPGDRIRRMTTPTGAGITATYDNAGRIVATATPGGRTWRATRDLAGRVTAVTFPDGTTATRTWGPGGVVTSETDPWGQTTRYERDPLGRPVTVRLPTGATESFTYDTADRVTSRTTAAGTRADYVLDAEGRATRTTLAGATALTERDAAGRPTAVTDPNGHRATYRWDVGRLAGVTDALGNGTRLDYDVRGLASLTDPAGRTRRFVRDARGNLLRQTLPGGASESFALDLAARTMTRTGFDGARTVSSFDLAGDLTQLQAADGTRATFTYNTARERVGFTDARGASVLVRDGAGRVTASVEPDGRTLRHAWSPRGELVSLTAPGATTRYEYDPFGRCTAVLDPAGRRVVFTWDAAGRRTGTSYPNGTAETRSYDTAGRLRSITVRAGATTLFGETYGYDPGGRVTRVDGADGAVTTYTYDALDRLLSERHAPAGGGAPETRAYSYDPAGNVLSVTDASGTRRYAHDLDDRLVSDDTARYRYDPEGRLLEITGGPYAATYRWDGLGRLVHAETTGAALGRHVVDYVYAADGLLAERREGSTVRRYLWDRARPVPQLVEESDDTGATVTRHLLADTALARDSGGVREYLHRDRMGTVRLVTDGAGAPLARRRFGPYGEGLAPGDAAPLGFAGELRDPATGLYYLRARWYAPHLARFLSRDPADPDPSDPRTLHRYAYALDAPTRFADPTGRIPSVEYAGLLRNLPFFLHVAGQAAAIGAGGISIATSGLYRAGGIADFGGAPDAIVTGTSKQIQVSSYFPLSEYNGFEALFGLPVNGHRGWFGAYFFIGGAVSGVTWAITFGTYSGAAWATPTPGVYTGWFHSFTAPAAFLLHAIGAATGGTTATLAASPLLSALLGATTITWAWSPSPSTDDAYPGQQFQAHTITATITWGFGGDEYQLLLAPTNFFTFAFTYYFGGGG